MKEIVKGIKRHIVDGDNNLSKLRMDICNKCPEKYEDIILGARCNQCGCVLKFKTKSDGKCPLGKW
tara:strand:- start:593 stop:790 length:198 start_codon:yes stop_codon:yes gene_type:complete